MTCRSGRNRVERAGDYFIARCGRCDWWQTYCGSILTRVGTEQRARAGMRLHQRMKHSAASAPSALKGFAKNK